MRTRIKFAWAGRSSQTLYFNVQARHRLWFWQTIGVALTLKEAMELKKKLDELKEEYL